MLDYVVVDIDGLVVPNPLGVFAELEDVGNEIVLGEGQRLRVWGRETLLRFCCFDSLVGRGGYLHPRVLLGRGKH